MPLASLPLRSVTSPGTSTPLPRRLPHPAAPPPPNTNVSHGDLAPVVTGDQPDALQAMQFGFTPAWAKKQFYMINARSEGDHNADNDPDYRGAMGILQKPMFRQSIRTRRCLVVADAFIEGPQREKLAKPYVVYARDGQRPFALAGIWDEWTDTATGELVRSFAIITTTACDTLQAIGHHRSPVLLDPADEQLYAAAAGGWQRAGGRRSSQL